MSDNGKLIGHRHPTTSGADYATNERDKAPPTIHHAPVIRADLTPRSPTRPPTPTRAFPRRLRQRARAKPDHGESPGKASLSAPGAGPVVGAGERKGRAGRSPLLRRRRARLARRFPAPRSARRRRAALAPRAAERRRLRQDPAPQRRRRRAARPALRRRRRRARPRGSFGSGGSSPAGRPASTPAGLAAAAAALDLALLDPNGLASSLKACAGEGDPVSAAAKAAALGVLRLPGRPSGRSRNPRSLGVRPRPRHPAALGAAACR